MDERLERGAVRMLSERLNGAVVEEVLTEGWGRLGGVRVVGLRLRLIGGEALTVRAVGDLEGGADLEVGESEIESSERR